MTGTLDHATRVVTGVCHHDCPDSCGWQVTVEDRPTGAVAVQLRGHPDHPYSRGELCPKVNRFLDRVHSPERVLHPMRRVGRKGEGRFEQVTWEEALADIGARLRGILDTHGPDTVMPYWSAGNQSVLALFYAERLWNRLGAATASGALCGAAAGAGSATTNGTGIGIDPSDVVHSRLIILWGTNTRLTNRHMWPFIQEAREAGAQVVVVDPLRTMTADSADWFLQPLPGTDVALMLGMMHVLVRDDLVDHEWVAAHTDGYDDLAAHVAGCTPEWAAAITGLPAADIERLARLYGTIRPSVIRTLIGAEHHEHGAMFFRALTCLPALVGAWKDRGGGYARSVGVWNDSVFDADALARPDLLAGRDPRQIPMGRLGRALTEPDDGGPPLQAVVFFGVNALLSAPNSELIRRGLSRDDVFTIVHDQFVTDTARYADYLLPATTQIEASDIVTPWGHLYLGWNEAAIAPLGESVSNSELHRRLAGALGFTPETDPLLFEDDLSALRAAFPTTDLDRLRADGWTRLPYPEDGRPFGDGVFPTASGKVELRCDGLASIGQPVLPTYTAPLEDELADAHPYLLMTPKQHTRFLNTSYSHLPQHGPREGSPFVELCAADAAALGLADGDQALVHNARGSLRVPVRIGDRVRPGVVAVPWGWWAHQYGSDGAVANSLTNDTTTDWGGGVAYWDTRVSVTRA